MMTGQRKQIQVIISRCLIFLIIKKYSYVQLGILSWYFLLQNVDLITKITRNKASG